MRKTPIIMLLIFMIITFGGGVLLRQTYKSGDLQQAIIHRAIPETQSATSSALIKRALGMEAARHYLVLFLNNTELRPGGGFIGSYGVIKLENGQPEILKITGSESLDNASPEVGRTPPPPLAKYLGIKKQQLRDSNWSPDFPTSAKLALELYREEGGEWNDRIDGVIGVTPSLFEEILKITGPVKVGDIEFNSSNFTEKLEYEVEYGYRDRGTDFSDRKKLLGELSRALLPKLLTTSFTHWKDYLELVPRMLEEKHVLLYSKFSDEQQLLGEKKWDGVLSANTGDYLLWTDSNLGSLKTDVAISRTLTYGTAYTATRKMVATVSMKYHHSGGFTWRTTRYRDYVRIFVPEGSKILSVTGATETSAANTNKDLPDEGVENGRHWFGSYITVEPGKKGQLTFTYILPDRIYESAKRGEYELLVQKQAGTINTRLTLGLNFDKNLSSAEPAEPADKFGDTKYDLVTDLEKDRFFKIQLSN